MMLVPTMIPFRTPVVDVIVATVGVPLVHVPPVTPSLSVVPVPAHSADGPDGVPGVAYTVMACVAAQLTPPPRL